MNLLRTLLVWVVILLLWSAPFIARRRGQLFWQTRFVWKWLGYVIVTWLGQAILMYIIGYLFGFVASLLLAGGEPSIENLFVFLVVFCAAEAVIVAWLIRKYAK